MAKEKNNKKANSRGITLVALVVTIVVLLILAGITITALFSENGIIKKAQEAKNKTEQDQIDTANGINSLIDQLNEQLGIVKVEPGELVDPTKKAVPYTDSTGTAYIPGGYCVVLGENNTVANGLVISDKAGDNMANDGKGNQFVWVPVPDVILDETKTVQSGTYTPMAKLQGESSENYMGMLYTFSTENGGTATYQTGYTPGTTTYREPAIVDGSSDGTGTSYDGDTANINPVLEDKYKDSTGTKKIQEQFQAQLQAEFNSMVASVDKYKGFYIGRYETGGLSGTAVVQKGNTDIGNQNWYTMYNKSKTLKGENNKVTTSMIWGCQWDATLRWFLTSEKEEVKNFVTNSTNKGNYSGSIASTGSKPEYSINNIYDMAGNVLDWTIEANSPSARVTRGGSSYNSGSDAPASYRNNGFPPNIYSNVGSRATLLLNP